MVALVRILVKVWRLSRFPVQVWVLSCRMDEVKDLGIVYDFGLLDKVK